MLVHRYHCNLLLVLQEIDHRINNIMSAEASSESFVCRTILSIFMVALSIVSLSIVFY